MNKKLKILLIFFTISLIVISIGIPNLPYKIPGKLKNSEYVELDIAITESTGGPEILSGSNSVTEYGEKMGYKNLNVHEVYLSKGNSLYNTVIKGISNSNNDYRRYHKFRVYGEFENGPDRYGVLTFNIVEWFPLGKYVAIKDTIEWDKYKIVNMKKHL
jgi:hypothetical protein